MFCLYLGLPGTYWDVPAKSQLYAALSHVTIVWCVPGLLVIYQLLVRGSYTALSYFPNFPWIYGITCTFLESPSWTLAIQAYSMSTWNYLGHPGKSHLRASFATVSHVSHVQLMTTCDYMGHSRMSYLRADYTTYSHIPDVSCCMKSRLCLLSSKTFLLTLVWRCEL